MICELKVPYADARAADLNYSLEPSGRPALERLVAEHRGLSVDLCVLGCSHQVTVSGLGQLTETVACLPDNGAGPLPGHHARRADGLDYQFYSTVEQLAPDRFAVHAQELLEQFDAHPCSLVALFPGSPVAFTALALDRNPVGVSWRTVHSYPETCELVLTSSEVWR